MSVPGMLVDKATITYLDGLPVGTRLVAVWYDGGCRGRLFEKNTTGRWENPDGKGFYSYEMAGRYDDFVVAYTPPEE